MQTSEYLMISFAKVNVDSTEARCIIRQQAEQLFAEAFF
jgi:hypothetical protein